MEKLNSDTSLWRSRCLVQCRIHGVASEQGVATLQSVVDFAQGIVRVRLNPGVLQCLPQRLHQLVPLTQHFLGELVAPFGVGFILAVTQALVGVSSGCMLANSLLKARKALILSLVVLEHD